MHSASLTSCRGSNSGFSSVESVKSAVQSSGSGLAPSPMKTIKKILIAHHDAGMRRLFEHELRAHFSCPVESCSPDELIAKPERALGALVLTPPGVLPRIAGSLPKTRPPLPAFYSDASPYLDAIRKLTRRCHAWRDLANPC